MNPRYMEEKIDYHIDEALIHLDHLTSCGYKLSNDDVFLELGTGYAIVEPLTMALLGIRKIITVDITYDLKFRESLKYIGMFKDAHIEKIEEKSLLSKEQIRAKLESLSESEDMEDLISRIGMEYVAPYQVNDLEKYQNEITVCYSQVVLEHVPELVMKDIFSASRIFLRPGGYHSHIVNLTDHFRNPGFFCDKNVCDVNFLKYSDKYWNSWCGNDIAYVNRLRFPYYINLFEETGFKVLDIEKQKQPERMNDLLSYEEIHEDIRSRYNKEELMDTLWVQRFHVILENPLG
jgi:hypothetical protein